MAHRASFDKRIPIGLAIAGTLGVALYLGYRKYRTSAAPESPKDGESAKKDTTTLKKESASSSSGTATSGQPAKPVASTELPKTVKAEPPKTPPKPQVPKRESAPPKPAPQEQPKAVIQEPKPHAPEPKPVVQERKPVIQEPKPVVEEPKPVIQEPKPVVQEPKPVIQESKPVSEEPKQHSPASASTAPEEKKSIPSPIDFAADQPSPPGKNAEVPVKVEPLSPKHKAEMASAAGIQLDTTAEAAAKSLDDSDPLISLQSWGELEDQFSTVNRRHSPSELHIPSSITTDTKADSNSNKVGDQDKDKSAFPESDSQAPQQGNS